MPIVETPWNVALFREYLQAEQDPRWLRGEPLEIGQFGMRRKSESIAKAGGLHWQS